MDVPQTNLHRHTPNSESFHMVEMPGSRLFTVLGEAEFTKNAAGNKTRAPMLRIVPGTTRSFSARSKGQIAQQMTTPPPENHKCLSIWQVKRMEDITGGLWKASNLTKSVPFHCCFCCDLAELPGFLSAVPEMQRHSEQELCGWSGVMESK